MTSDGQSGTNWIMKYATELYNSQLNVYIMQIIIKLLKCDYEYHDSSNWKIYKNIHIGEFRCQVILQIHLTIHNSKE